MAAPTYAGRRRPAGDGSVYRTEDGRWRGVVDLGFVDGKRKRKYVSGPTQAEAVGKLRQAQRESDASFTATDGNLIVKVMDVAPDGTVRQASVGYLKASHTLSQSKVTRVVPGQVKEYVISVWPTDWRFQKGHRLRISLTSGDYPKVAADAPSGTVTIDTGQGGSYVDLPGLP